MRFRGALDSLPSETIYILDILKKDVCSLKVAAMVL